MRCREVRYGRTRTFWLAIEEYSGNLISRSSSCAGGAYTRATMRSLSTAQCALVGHPSELACAGRTQCWVPWKGIHVCSRELTLHCSVSTEIRPTRRYISDGWEVPDGYSRWIPDTDVHILDGYLTWVSVSQMDIPDGPESPDGYPRWIFMS